MKTNEKKSYKVQIFGDPYTLVSDEVENNILQSARLVDELMKSINQDYRITDPKKIAVLTALRIMHKLIILEEELDHNEHKMAVLVNLIDQNVFSLFHQ
ncbi:MAG: cell division protein ZapA [Candidatus Babeliales bacterium]|jgi:cell division protein ZapA (FtsZ GTPase activity inhibitor)